MNNTAKIENNSVKFSNPIETIDGSQRAWVPLGKPETLWFNTGTLCNIACKNCYIESSPSNDRLVYISTDEVVSFLNQIEDRNWPITEIGLTGGEPFLNHDIIDIMRSILQRNFKLIVLTNAMRPLMRPHIQAGLLDLVGSAIDRITLRVSLDHYSAKCHDQIRGQGAFKSSIMGMNWLHQNGFKLAVAGRRLWNENTIHSKIGYAKLFKKFGYDLDVSNPAELVLFPEMDLNVDVPEITEDCWRKLGKSKLDIMCSSSRMVVKHRGDSKPSVIACTLLPYASEFNLGNTLAEAEKSVSLNHPYCAQFCVLGSASCSPVQNISF